eukprot:CAMPEP_0204075510 /NCGR_PEP_ID=MMETSP0360-20130528/166434_1 /ASSEMBLY_ACC=CAM_ASM_000342 /TAXON_ID=268821 /ORGANISM="Scrippsiella Hangoei, Strain SHTV-5" /LENGTH=71 /DNA_ID=CAMNT_0051024009 /DNA_START=89 /DNA_END=301 /DNA_ORIENTATION=-
MDKLLSAGDTCMSNEWNLLTSKVCSEAKLSMSSSRSLQAETSESALVETVARLEVRSSLGGLEPSSWLTFA